MSPRPFGVAGVLLALTTGATVGLVAQSSRPSMRSAPIDDVRYDVTINAELGARHRIHSSMTFRTGGADPVVLSLPAWTPGKYRLDNFARYVTAFSARAGAAALHWDKLDFDTWRVFPTGAQTVTVSFEYRWSDTLDVGMAAAFQDFAYFNGTNLFLYPEGQSLLFASHLTIHTEPDWRIATGFTPAGAPGRYEAADYHELVDMPTFVGRFDLDSMEIDGVWHRMATYPEGGYRGAARETLWSEIQLMMSPMAAVFGETPFDSYTTLMVFDDGYPGASALEHRNSHLGIYFTEAAGLPFLTEVWAHETVHAWVVKRLRPAEMVPYDYGRAQPTTLLWVAEGVDDYYADLAMVRGGVVPPTRFYQRTADKIRSVASTPPVALEDASLSTWIAPVDGTAHIYYDKGSLAGLLLDVLIRDASENRGSLDDVMRNLYVGTYQAGRGFTDEQWWRAVSQAADGRSFEDVRRRYIDGREPYPWDDVLPLVGLELSVDTVMRPLIGVFTGVDSAGIRVQQLTAGGAAEAAGVQVGDYLLRVGEIEVVDDQFGAQFRARYEGEEVGTPYQVTVRRGSETLTLDSELRLAPRMSFTVRELPNASARAVALRDGILTGSTRR
ncbi:MAG: M61 family metallopeptidase [Gemmatimonadota bacterium]|nr:MAG: M61 family metallopeptidase [Gemmatimonadota bacterium]